MFVCSLPRWPAAAEVIFTRPDHAVRALRASVKSWHKPCGVVSTAGRPAACRIPMTRERKLPSMKPDLLEDYIDAVSKALALPVEEAWKPAVKANLEVSLRLARLVDEFALPDETEPASVFAA